MLADELARLVGLLEAAEEGEKPCVDAERVKAALRKAASGELRATEIPRKIRRFLIEENILFYDPTRGTVRPQGRLIQKAIINLPTLTLSKSKVLNIRNIKDVLKSSGRLCLLH